MLTPAAIDATARECLEMYRTRARYRPLAAPVRAAPLDDAYRIQDALHRLMAEAGRGEIAGWKIALTSKTMQQMTGVDQPAAGAIFSTVVHPSPARVDLAAYHHLGVEFEVAVRLGDDLPSSSGPWTRASVADRVAACLPACPPSSWWRTAAPTTRRSTPSPSWPRTPGTAGWCSGRR